MSHAEFTRHRNRAAADTIANPTVIQSTIEARPSCQLTYAINASDPTLTPSRNAPAIFDLRIRGINGPLAATSKNAGKKMPTVATTEPGSPPSRYPMKVAVVNTGPGVSCPTATASINCESVSQPRCTTRSARRNASKTYPLPNTTAPIFRKTRNSDPRLKDANDAPAPPNPINEKGRLEHVSLLPRIAMSVAANPANKSSTSGCNPRNAATSAQTPMSPRNVVFTAVFPSPQSA